MPIAKQFFISTQEMSSHSTLSDQKNRHIHSLWELEQKRLGGKLHEGRILSAIACDNKALTGQFVSYKLLLAQRRDYSLKSDLKIVPVGVCGLTWVGNDLLVGKRADWLPEYPDHYELAPAGYIRPPCEGEVDLKQEILERLLDELHTDSQQVKSINFYALVRDLKMDAVLLCSEIKLKPVAILSSSDTYSQVLTIPAQEIPLFLEAHKAEFVPLSLQLLRMRKLI